MLKRVLQRIRAVELAAAAATLGAAASALADGTQPPTAPVPEPSAALIFAVGVAGVIWAVRRRS